MYQALLVTVGYALSVLVIAGNAEVKGELKTAFSSFVETVLTYMAKNGLLDKVFDCIIER